MTWLGATPTLREWLTRSADEEIWTMTRKMCVSASKKINYQIAMPGRPLIRHLLSPKKIRTLPWQRPPPLEALSLEFSCIFADEMASDIDMKQALAVVVMVCGLA